MEARKLSEPQPPPFVLSLRIRHPSIDPADLSRELLVQAEHAFRAGEPRQPHGNRTTASVHAESYWLGTLDPASWPADSWLAGTPGLELAQKALGKAATSSLGLALSLGATRFLRTHAMLLDRIRIEGGQVSLLVVLSPVAVGSFSLTPEAALVFSKLGITVEFEFAND